MYKAIFTMFLAALVISIGNGLLSKGLRELDQMTWNGTLWENLVGRISLALHNPILIVGGLCHGTFFALMLLAFSWADLSVVFPVTAFSYVFVAIISKIYLQEDVNILRWVGSAVITVGVFIVIMGEQKNEAAAKNQPTPAPIVVEKKQ